MSHKNSVLAIYDLEYLEYALLAGQTIEETPVDHLAAAYEIINSK